MSGESPGRTAVQTCGSESALKVAAELLVHLVHTLVQIIRNLLEGIEILNVIRALDNRVVQCAVIGKQCLVVDDAVCFIAVCDRNGLVIRFDVQGVIRNVLVKIGVTEVIQVIFPCRNVVRIADVEDGRSFALCHFRLECCSVLSVRSCKNSYVAAKIIVLGSQFLPGLICLGLEVQKINSSAIDCSRVSRFCRCCRSLGCCRCCSFGCCRAGFGRRRVTALGATACQYC